MYMKRSLRLHNYLKTFLFLAIFGFNAQVSFGQLLDENFSYTAGSNLTINGWAVHGIATPTIAVSSASITYPGYLSSGVGEEVSMAVSGQDVNRTFTSQASGTTYVSFLVNVTSATITGDYFFNVGATSIGTAFKGRIFVRRDASNNVSFGIAQSTTAASYTAASYSLNTTYLIVLKYDIVTGLANDVASIYVNPPLNSAIPSSGWIANTDAAGTDLGNLGSVALRQGGTTTGAALKIDGIRVSTVWSDIVGDATPTTVWTNSWSNNLPDNTKDAIINGVYNSNVGGSQVGFETKKLKVTTNGNLTIKSGTNIIVQDDVINNGLLTVESNANLVQANNTTNSGNITVKRDTNPLMRFDYVMWSTPVDGTQKLLNFSPLTSLAPAIRFYTYDNVNNVYVSVPDPANTEFVNATGYLIRLPFDHPTAAAVWTGTFSGVPNNGPVGLTSLTPGQFYATGNPYPSTISADLFISENGLTDALYFWRKTNGAAGSAYATYTLAGGTFPAPGTTATATSGIPNGTIQVGQGFIAKANGTSLVFNNLMRATPNNDNQTFRSASAALPTTVEKNRFWLNLSNATETIGQTLVSYMTGATNGLDAQIDGKYINDSATALTSLIAGEEFTVQGKTLPFTASDVVPLGFKAQTAGNYSISLFDKDGLFSSNGQIIYLRDNLTNTVQNLNSGAYNFTSQAGVFNGRFDVVYQNALSTDVVDFTSNNVYIYNQNNVLNINSGTNTMSAVKVYDVLGRLLAQNNKVNASQTQINVPVTNQTLIVQITSSEGTVVVKKVAN